MRGLRPDLCLISPAQVIRVARKCYHQIHEEIRAAEFRVFDAKRIRVSFSQKLRIARTIIPGYKQVRTPPPPPPPAPPPLTGTHVRSL